MIRRHTPREGPHNVPGHRRSAATRCRLSPVAVSWNRFAADRHRSRQAGSDPLPVEPGRCKLESICGGSPPLAVSRPRFVADCARSLQDEIDPRPMDIVALHADIDWMSLDIVPLPAGRDSHSDDRAPL